MPETSPFDPPGLMRAIEPEEMLKRLVLALRGAGYTVRSYSYECLIDQVQSSSSPGPHDDIVAALNERLSHPAPTVEVPDQSHLPDQPQGETHE